MKRELLIYSKNRETDRTHFADVGNTGSLLSLMPRYISSVVSLPWTRTRHYSKIQMGESLTHDGSRQVDLRFVVSSVRVAIPISSVVSLYENDRQYVHSRIWEFRKLAGLTSSFAR
jgi:hypothetical protein